MGLDWKLRRGKAKRIVFVQVCVCMGNDGVGGIAFCGRWTWDGSFSMES